MSDRIQGRRLASLFRSGGWPARLALGLPLVAAALLVVQTWLLAFVLHRAIVLHVDLPALTAPITVILSLIAARALLGALGEMAGIEASERIKERLRARLFGAVLRKPPIWTAGRSSGGLSTLLIEQVNALDGFFVRYMPAMAQAAIVPIAFAAAVLPVDWIVALVFLVTAPLIPVFMALAGWGAQAASQSQAGALARLAGYFSDRLKGLVTLKLFGRDAAETAAMFNASEELRRRSMKVMRIAFLSSAVLEFFAALGVAGVALYCGLSLLGLIHLRASPLGLEAALFCLLMAPEVYQPLRLLAAHYHDRAGAKAALDQIEQTLGDVLDERPIAAEPAPAHTPMTPIAVTCRAVSIADPTGQPAVRNIELAVPAGRHIAILGQSGSGKSTLIEALARLREHTGDIRLDGISLDDMAEPTLRRAVALIGQRPHLFAGSIADNIRLGRRDSCDTAVRVAAQRALVTRFADHLPLSLDTPVGEAGLGLSGGEAQRVALARLFLRDPGLILLDEPTAHLDPATESDVLDQLLIFARHRTMIVATHSLSVAARMDRAYRLVDGRLVDAVVPSQRDPRSYLLGAA